MAASIDFHHITAAHQLYCQLTGQTLRLGFDRERQWYEWLRAGFTLEDLRRVVAYLQREIRLGRRNVGALKLSNLLQLDRFEEDLNIIRASLCANHGHRLAELVSPLLRNTNWDLSKRFNLIVLLAS